MNIWGNGNVGMLIIFSAFGLLIVLVGVSIARIIRHGFVRRPAHKRVGVKRLILAVLGGLSFIALVASMNTRMPQSVAPVKVDTRNLDEKLVVLAEGAVREQLKDPDSAKFKKSRVYRGLNNIPVVCGEVNAKTGFGGYGGYKGYIAAGKQVFVEEQMEPNEFVKAWNRICRN